MNIFEEVMKHVNDLKFEESTYTSPCAIGMIMPKKVLDSIVNMGYNTKLIASVWHNVPEVHEFMPLGVLPDAVTVQHFYDGLVKEVRLRGMSVEQARRMFTKAMEKYSGIEFRSAA